LKGRVVRARRSSTRGGCDDSPSSEIVCVVPQSLGNARFLAKRLILRGRGGSATFDRAQLSRS
jgi:hypothetical protein